MSQTIHAIFENGMIRPLQNLDLDNGEELEVIVVKRADQNPSDVRSILSRIADLPIENNDGSVFSGADHDEILYSPTEQ